MLPNLKTLLKILVVVLGLAYGVRYSKGVQLEKLAYKKEATTLKQQLENSHRRESLLSLAEAVATIPKKYSISDEVVSVLLEKESSGGNMQAIRFEPGQMKRAAKFTKNKDEQRMLASSHCALQIMGYNAAVKNIHWSELYKPEVCVELGMNIWSRCREKRCKELSKYDCISATAACYNGSQKYADDFMVRLSKRLINREAHGKIHQGDK